MRISYDDNGVKLIQRLVDHLPAALGGLGYATLIG